MLLDLFYGIWCLQPVCLFRPERNICKLDKSSVVLPDSGAQLGQCLFCLQNRHVPFQNPPVLESVFLVCLGLFATVFPSAMHEQPKTATNDEVKPGLIPIAMGGCSTLYCACSTRPQRDTKKEAERFRFVVFFRNQKIPTHFTFLNFPHKFSILLVLDLPFEFCWFTCPCLPHTCTHAGSVSKNFRTMKF